MQQISIICFWDLASKLKNNGSTFTYQNVNLNYDVARSKLDYLLVFSSFLRDTMFSYEGSKRIALANFKIERISNFIVQILLIFPLN